MSENKEQKVSPKKKPAGNVSSMIKILKGPKPKTKYSPSLYLAEMSLLTAERLSQTKEIYSPQIIKLLDITENATFKDSSVGPDQALFQPFPSEVIFQQFKKKETYEFPLCLRNLDKVARHIKITQKKSPYFSVVSSRPSGQKVAPGMEALYTVVFTPDDDKDYNHELICITEREEFCVPVRAIGPRALLDFPDKLHFNSAPVKHTVSKPVLVRNIGNVESKVELKTEQPFSVSPLKFSLKPKACLQVEVSFNPKLIGDHSQELKIEYDTGDAVHVQLHGSAVNVNVRLDKSSLLMDTTYIGLSSQRTVCLSNRSSIPVHFEWKSMSSEEEEIYQKDCYTQQLMDEESSSKDAFLERCLHNPSVRDRFPILSHTYQNRKKMVSDEKFLFTDLAFSMDPLEGEIWPDSQAEITVTFQPEKSLHYSAVAFCDVTGRENRLPLKFKGDGCGPRLKFSFDTLDIQNVFVNSAHAYEVVLENSGDIDADYSLLPSSTLFGPKFSFNPSSGHLLPDSLQAIQISFSSSTLGRFEEEFIWMVEGSPEQLRLRIMGNVIGPTFQFNVPEINFSTISYGFPVTQEVILINTSEVLMTFALSVPLEDKGASTGKKEESQEFVIQPKTDTLPPNIHQPIKITFTPRHVRPYSTFLVMDIAEVGQDVFSLPIKANSIVPRISLSPPTLEFGRCFINHPYILDLELCNDDTHGLPVHYEMIKLPEDSPILCTTSKPKGVIEGQQGLSIPLTIEAQTTGPLSVNCSFCILGSSDPPLVVELHCIGEGPVISVTPGQLDWGVCPVLTPIPKKLVLSNQSEIVAMFEAIFMRENGVFKIQPMSGVVAPREKMELSVIAELDDSVSFTDKLTIFVQRGVSHTVSLSAEGRGTTIVSHPPLYPRVDLGTNFAFHQCFKQFVLTNRGRRTQALSWTTEGFSMVKLKKAEMEKAARDKKDLAKKQSVKSNKADSSLKKPLFQITPDKFILPPSHSETVVITGYSAIPQTVTERLVCHSVIGRNPHKEKIMGVDVTSHFTAPLLEFSQREVKFVTKQLPGSDLVKHSQDIIVSRVSPLPLTVMMTCNYPFSMAIGPEKEQQFLLELSLLSDEDVTITVVYDSTYCVDRQSRVENQKIEVTYKEHPQKDYISLQAEVYFPNLQFESERLEFGCLLNDTELVKTLRMTNTSPLEVQYSWSFLKRPPIQRVDPVNDDEGVDMQSDICETDSLEEGGSSRTGPDDRPSTPEGGQVVGGVTVTINSPSPEKPYNEKLEVDTCERPDDERVIEGFSQSLPPSEDSTVTSVTTITEEDKGSEEETAARKRRIKDPWEVANDPFVPIAIEQVFDILPLYGVLSPGETQEMQVTFYGHADIATEVVAVCKVEGGPSYQLVLAGEASTIQYKIDRRRIQLQNIVYDSVCEEEITLTNIGKVCLEYRLVETGDSINYDEVLPGIPSVQPAVGQIEALESQKLQVKFFPGTSRPFKKTFKIQIAHFEPETITIIGNGCYPRISLSLPRPAVQGDSNILEEVRAALTNTRRTRQKQVSPVELECELERLTINRFVQEHGLKYVNNIKSTKARPIFPEYHLDFGCVVSGLTATKRIVLTNIGNFPISFSAPHSSLSNTGFSVNLSTKVKDLPCGETIDFTVQFDPASVNRSLGCIETELPFQLLGGPVYPLKLSATVTLPLMEVSSDNLDFGIVVCGQCKIITIRLYNPRQVKCQWNAITDKPPKKIPKHTPLHIRKKMKEKPPPNYFELDPPNSILLPGQKIDVQVKFMPSDETLYSDRIPLVIFQNPEANMALNVTGRGSEPHVRLDKNLLEFAPILPFSEGSEAEVTFSNPLSYPIEIYSLEFDQQYQEEEDMLRWVKGYDMKHRLFLPPAEVGQSLPHEIVEAYKKKNLPADNEGGPHPVDSGTCKSGHDLNYISEEHSGSNVSLGPSVSQAVVDAHPHLAELQARLPSSTALLPQMVGASLTSVLSQGTLKVSSSDPNLDGLEMTPVAACLARYLGIDISPEAALAETKKGVAIIIYGPQLSGKSIQAKCLSEAYSAPILNIDELIIEAISSASTPAGCKARELCIEATNAAEAAAAELAALAETPTASKVNMSLQKKSSRALSSATRHNKEEEEEPKGATPEPFTVNPLHDTPYAASKGTLIPVKLPEETILEILMDRIQQTDCRKGVVFDGLDCRFINDQLMSAALILKAFGDRKHIFFINLEMDSAGIKERIEKIEQEKQQKKEEEEHLKKEEEQRIQDLLDMSEDEYELLSREKQREIDEIRHQRYMEKRKRKQLEKEEAERLEREKREEELRLQEEEKAKGKKGRAAKVQQQHQPTDQLKVSPAHGVGSRPGSATSQRGSLVNPSAASFVSTTESASGRRKSLIHGAKDMKSEEENEDDITKNFLTYKSALSGIKNLLSDWDRVKGVTRPKQPPPPVEPEQGKVSATPKKKGRKSQSRADASPGRQQPPPHPLQQNMVAGIAEGGAAAVEEEEESREGLGVPIVSVPATSPVNEVTFAIRNAGLPSPDEILKSLGIYLEESPIPEPVTFQVYPYPLKRRPVQATKKEHFNFISTGPNDINVLPLNHGAKDSPEPAIIEEPGSKESPEPPPAPSRLKHSGSRRKSVKPSSRQGKSSPSPQHQEDAQSLVEHLTEVAEQTPKRLVRFRWVIPPRGECKVRLLFTSDEEGQFDHILNFEIMGTRRHYQLFCRGICQFPSISRDPRIVFPHRKKTAKKEEIVHKRYIMEKELYQFGPLHCGKPREKYREGRYKENMETVTISNPTFTRTEVGFCFRHDVSASTFLLEPPDMTLEPGESQQLNIWAYPKSSGEFRDDIVCTVKHRPEPVTFPIMATGVEPELKIDKKVLEFGKVLLHRRETRVLHLRNPTLLPVAWKLNGQETLGDEFSFSQEQGIVQPKTEFPLTINFRAMKQHVPPGIKKAFKIEISDVEQIIGLINVETVGVNAEAYDVQLDISFPKGTGTGPEGGLDFGVLMVYMERSLTMTLRNKGRYEMGYNFLFDVGPGGQDYSKWFLLNPSSSVLYAGEKPKSVSVIFKPDKEVDIMDQPILKCQVIDTHLGEHGEVIANIPIRFTAKSVYSKYSVSPLNDVNFGCLVITSRKTNSFTIENKGDYEFRFCVSKRLPPEVLKMKQNMTNLSQSIAGGGRTRRELSVSSRASSVQMVGRPAGRSKEPSLRYEVVGSGSQRLVLGVFSIAPAYGAVGPGQTQTINVDCVAERAGKHEEFLSIEVSDANRKDMPMEYKICCEVLVPGINTTDLPLVFEEHRVCKELGVLGQHQFHEDGCVGVFGESEKRFLFKSVIIGHSSRARFRIINSNKIPCDVNVNIRSSASSGKAKATLDVFEVDINKVSIGAHSHVYATVTFKPLAIQVYNALFEVTVDGPPQARSRGLTFDLQGEGNLPQVSIIRPQTCTEKGDHLLLFRKLLIGEKQVQPIVLRNTGTTTANVVVELSAEGSGEGFGVLYSSREEEEEGDDRRECVQTGSPLTIDIPVGGTRELLVSFRPQLVQVYKGRLMVRVNDNQFETMPISLIGEGYQDDVVVQNIRGPVSSMGMGPLSSMGMGLELMEGDLEGVKANHLQFGGLPVGEHRSLTFTLTNYSDSDFIKFKWPPVPGLTFSPSVGHLYPSSSKEVTVTLTVNKPKTFKCQKFVGKYWQIKYTKPVNQGSEWDDRVRTVKWVNTPVTKKSDDKAAVPPIKKKVIETETEPSHEVTSAEGGQDIDMHFSAIVAYTEYECPTRAISFKDTYVLQTNIFKFPLKNTGQIDMSYKWFLVDPSLPAAIAAAAGLDDNSRSSISSATGTELESVTNKGVGHAEEEEEVQVSIEPQEGEIPSGGEQIITVKFSPLQLIEFTHIFRCQIPNLTQSVQPLDLLVTGGSILPYCHFDLPENDYISNRRSISSKGITLLSSGSAGSISPSTKVIEFTSTGIGQKIQRVFHITNPTELNYEFQWSCDESPTSSHLTPPIFTCLTPRGQVTGGKKYQIMFEYHPPRQQLTESLWHFSIPSLSLTVPFLLVGHTLEPKVNIDRAYLNFRSLLVGTSSKETIYLINNEEKPYQFKFNDKTCLSDTPKAKLVVVPMSGVIKPHEKLPVVISFTAHTEKEFIFNLQCNVKKKTTPLTLNVKAMGHSINVGVSAINDKGEEVMLTSGGGANRGVDFGKISVNERALWQLSVYNYCDFELFYQFMLSDVCNRKGGVEEKLISITPQEGTVQPQDKATAEMTFSPASQMVLKNCDILLKIMNGPTIPISLKGAGVEPKASFSFLEYDFGPRLLHHPHMSNVTTLVITNNDKTDLNINCSYSKTSIMELLQFEPGLLPPGECMHIDCQFRPSKPVKYKETFMFEINGVCKKKVTIKGEGTLMKVEVLNPSQRNINLGALRVGESASKQVKLVNRSLLSVVFTVSIVPSTQTPVLHQEGVLSVTLYPTKGQTLGEMKEITLKAKEEVDVEVKFSPPSRVPQFSEEVIMEAHGQSHPLFVVSGSCHGVELALDSNHVPFGAVVKSSQSTRRVLLMNTGDIGARFKWDKERFGPDFSISPVEGYISSGMEIPFTVTFHPQQLNQDIRYDKLPCQIEGSTPLMLTLTGMCVDQTPNKEVLHFITTVRSKETRQITMHNKTAIPWLLHPIINGEHWSGPVTLSIPPGGVAHYELTYYPLVMTTETQKHTGSIFFPLPDGTGQLHNLLGTADPPKNSGSIAKDIPCKTSHTELLTVENWLRVPQRFRAYREMIRPEKLDRSVNLYGNDYIDVPALGKKDYQLYFYSFKEGSYLSKVTFINEATGEYQFFHVHFKSVPPGIMGMVELTTAVRQRVSHTLTIENPFPNPINMYTSVNCGDITIPTSFLIGAESQGKCTFEYLPLKVGETTGKLTLQSPELGAYNYELVLTATPPAPERTVHFTTSLGNYQPLPCHFTSYSKGRTEYTCKVDNSDFHVEKTITVAASEASVDVSFEPSTLGDTKATLTISSSSGGDYLIPLQGHCLMPRPQGPFTVKAGSSISIPFRNIFHHSKQFRFSIDNPAFSVKGGDTLKPRKVYNIIVQFEKGGGDHGAKSKQIEPAIKLAKLVVTCVQSASQQGKGGEGFQWTYYLKGLPPESNR